MLWGRDCPPPYTTQIHKTHKHNTMPKVISKRTFLLKRENGKDIIAKKGESMTVSAEDYKKFKSDFIELKK